MKIIRCKTRFVKEADQVNIRRVIQLMSAHLAHRENTHPACIRDIIFAHARKFSACNLSSNRCAQRACYGEISKFRQNPCDFFKRPNTA